MSIVEDQLAVVAAISDLVERARKAGELVAEHQRVVGELSRVRREALEDLVAQGETHTTLGKKLDMTRARVSQLLSSGPRSERAFLGNGELTVALGGKQESGNNKPALSQDDFHAYEDLRELASTFNLSSRYEVIQPPGFINLNRDNLVVICGPRLSPLLEQVLQSDANLAFERDQQGWYLVDRGEGVVYRSPMDAADEPSDYAYLGRLPRIDGRGSFLYMAGIHAVGCAGAAHYIANNITELYKELRRNRFSVLIKCEFDPETRRITHSSRVSDFYKAG